MVIRYGGAAGPAERGTADRPSRPEPSCRDRTALIEDRFNLFCRSRQGNRPIGRGGLAVSGMGSGESGSSSWKAFNNNQLDLHPLRDDVFDEDTDRHAGENPRLFFCQPGEVWRQLDEDAVLLDRADHAADRFARLVNIPAFSSQLPSSSLWEREIRPFSTVLTAAKISCPVEKRWDGWEMRETDIMSIGISAASPQPMSANAPKAFQPGDPGGDDVAGDSSFPVYWSIHSCCALLRERTARTRPFSQPTEFDDKCDRMPDPRDNGDIPHRSFPDSDRGLLARDDAGAGSEGDDQVMAAVAETGLCLQNPSLRSWPVPDPAWLEIGSTVCFRVG